MAPTVIYGTPVGRSTQNKRLLAQCYRHQIFGKILQYFILIYGYTLR
ncbi:hypothetical protein Plhal304r1_c057g0142761 [Plasmopara halstedii]